MDAEFGIQEPLTVRNRPYEQRAVRISLLHVGTSSWLLGEQHRRLEASALLPKAVPKCWQALVGRDELFILLQEAGRRQGTLADPATVLLQGWHH